MLRLSHWQSRLLCTLALASPFRLPCPLAFPIPIVPITAITTIIIIPIILILPLLLLLILYLLLLFKLRPLFRELVLRTVRMNEMRGLVAFGAEIAVETGFAFVAWTPDCLKTLLISFAAIVY